MYDLHALVSPFHLRTLPGRLIVVGGKTLEAFLVESEEQLEARYQAHLVTSGRVSTSGLQRAAYVNLCLFNYLILNTDWNVFNRHNVECFQIDNSRDLVAIPYDFDYSGMVAAAYALPHTSQDIASVSQPKWLGRHVSETELKEGAAVFLAVEARLRDHVDRCQGLTDRDHDQLLKRLDKFYAVLKNEKKLLGLLGHRGYSLNAYSMTLAPICRAAA